ncbi:MAG: outer membrane protein transport protein, partial [Deltaproteobacteria bacterium]|nr:outer membrane protein transport protein [Deltaproteobacteria bacterium]
MALLLALFAAPIAHAGSIATAGVTGGPDSGAATSNPAAVVYNPAALAGTEGVEILADVQASFVRLEVTTTRNGGIDPNTNEPYLPAFAKAVVPNGVLGISWQAVPDRLTFAFAANDPFVGGGDYTGSETGTVPPYTGHQRYHILDTRILTFALTPAVAVTTVDGVRLGAGVSYVIDRIDILSASDPLGTEGRRSGELDQDVPENPYALDTQLELGASGHHWAWNAGIFVDRWDAFRFGLSYASSGRFQAAGDGTVTVPQDMSTEEGGVSVPALVTVEFPLPAIGRFYFDSQVTEKVNLGAGIDYQMWNVCCGGPDADIAIGLTNESGNAIGPDDGVTIEIDKDQYNPRRLWNSMGISQLGGVQFNEDLWAGWRLMYNQNAVPDYAVSPSNLDFSNVGFSLGAR